MIQFNLFYNFIHLSSENPSNDENNAPIANVVSKEEDDDGDMDDQMTMVGPSLDNLDALDSLEDELALATDTAAAKAAVVALAETKTTTTPESVAATAHNQSAKEPKAKEPKAKELKAPSRIIQRRSTLGSGLISAVTSTPLSRTSNRKRRMSIADHSNEFEFNSRTRSQANNDVAPHTAKKMRHNSSTDSNRASKANNSSKTKPFIKLPISNHNSKHDKSSEKRAKKTTTTTTTKSTTPPITQFFRQKSPIKCDKCAVQLKRPIESDFHVKFHEHGRCIKCKRSIKSDNPANIHKHMISCLFISKKFPRERLSRFLTAEVCLDRLTPNKIKEIQKNLGGATKLKGDDTATAPTVPENAAAPKIPESRPSERRSEDIEPTQCQADQPTKQTAAEDAPMVNDNEKDGKYLFFNQI